MTRKKRLCCALSGCAEAGELRRSHNRDEEKTRGLVGPDFGRVGFEGVDVDHPVEDDGNEVAAGGVASLFRGDVAGETEFGVIDL